MATDNTDPLQEALFREVDEDLRSDRISELWKTYGNLVIAAAAALVLGVGGYEGWRAWDAKQRDADSLRYATAAAQAEDGKTAAALEALGAASAEGGAGYRAIAALHRAALLVSSGDGAGAVALYRKIMDDDGLDDAHRDAARLLAALHSVDQGDPKDLEALVAPLAVPGNPWRFSALEIKALLALRQGDRKHADSLLIEIADSPGAPAGARARASEMMTPGPSRPITPGPSRPIPQGG